jgi:hypothetical protein
MLLPFITEQPFDQRFVNTLISEPMELSFQQLTHLPPLETLNVRLGPEPLLWPKKPFYV